MIKKNFVYLIAILLLMFIVSCSSQEKTQENLELIDEKIPPGSVIVNCEIQKIEFANNTYLVSALVNSVHGYGSDTKIVIEGEKIFFNVSADLFKKNIYKNGNVVVVELIQSGTGTESGLEIQTNNIWKCVRIIKK
jgi:hypothetical protein